MKNKYIYKVLIGLFLLNSSASFAQVKIGDNANVLTPSAILEVESTNSGILTPRLTTVERNAIANPARGLVIYNTTVNCLEVFNSSTWINLCTGEIGAATVNTGGGGFNGGEGSVVFPQHAPCAGKMISISSCSTVPGAVMNDTVIGDNLGIEYDWPAGESLMATGIGAVGFTRNLTEIGGQCWFARNATTPPSKSEYNDPIPALNTNPSPSGQFDNGHHRNYPDNISPNFRLYNWLAAMNGSKMERAQGVCPDGFHIPSDCEWKYMEFQIGLPESLLDENDVVQNGRSDTIFNIFALNVNKRLGATSDFSTPGSPSFLNTNNTGFNGGSIIAGSFNQMFFPSFGTAWWSSSRVRTGFGDDFNEDAFRTFVRIVVRNTPAIRRGGVYGYQQTNAVRCLRD